MTIDLKPEQERGPRVAGVRQKESAFLRKRGTKALPALFSLSTQKRRGARRIAAALGGTVRLSTAFLPAPSRHADRGPW
jgi:hypothetical protein